MAEATEVAPTEVGQRGRCASPLVSGVVPAYNCARFIGESLDSVYRQTYGNWEVVVIDDGSTDETRAALAPHIGRIRYFYQENRGTAAARNAGVRQARGELIAFLDNDDIWLPEKLARQVQVMQGSLECGLVFTDGKRFSADGIRAESLISTRLDGWMAAHRTEGPLVAKGDIVRNLFFDNEISSASICITPWITNTGCASPGRIRLPSSRAACTCGAGTTGVSPARFRSEYSAGG